MIYKIGITGFVATAVLAGLTVAFGAPHQAANCVFGGVLVSTNLAVVYWTIRQIFMKKSVALAIAVIVFKYAILLILFLLLYRSGWRIDGGFIVGLLAMFPTIVVMARKYIKNSEPNDPL